MKYNENEFLEKNYVSQKDKQPAPPDSLSVPDFYSLAFLLARPHLGSGVIYQTDLELALGPQPHCAARS